ncbi:low-density lipoprotein receptor-related protein 4-like [Patella vulgata]|uniref:low-density lipoprotein receptor-related protein 4-like n=1 Tax=Patella vulgata TaxID=6465 RepID=UPI0024A97488|nr:low-density lipoprotein receptor-related protein 4-like [Patella vulgata]
MDIFDPSDGANATAIERINLMGGWGGASCSIDFNYRGNMIYWADYYVSKVYSLKADGGDQEQKVILGDGLDFPEGLAYDWIHNNLYVSDFRQHEIMVINPETGAKKTLITDVPDVRDVEVDPKTGWLYWICGWEETAVLMKSALDGQNQVVISSDLDRPRSLSLDYDEQKLYWTELPPFNSIKSISVDGENLTTVYQTVTGRLSTPPKYLTISRDYIYWNQGHESIRRADKQQITENTRYRKLEEHDANGKTTNLFMGILAIDPRKQTESPSLCGDNNGGCSHFCLPTLMQSIPPYNCACPDGMNLMNDNSTCSDETQI